MMWRHIFVGMNFKHQEAKSLEKFCSTGVYRSLPNLFDRYNFNSYNAARAINNNQVEQRKAISGPSLDKVHGFADDGLIELKSIKQTEFSRKVLGQYIDGKYRYLVKEIVATPELLFEAYNNLIELAGNPPKGDAMQMASDGVGISWFVRTAKELREGTFRVSNYCLDVLPKTDTENVEYLRIIKLRLKIVLEALRLVLREIYGPKLSPISHGFHVGTGRHTALRQIKSSCKGASWWITFDIHKKFDLENFTILLVSLKENIQDRRLFDLLAQMFHAGILELDIGGPVEDFRKENILSPLLINIYFDLFDREVDHLKEKIASLSLIDEPKHENEMYFQTSHSEGATGVKLVFSRYFDEILLAVGGPKQLASSIKSEIIAFLSSKLCIDVNHLKSKLVHASSGSVRFVGMDLQFMSISGIPNPKSAMNISSFNKAKHRVRVLALQQRLHWETGLRKIGRIALTSILKDSRNPDSGNRFLNKNVMNGFDLLWRGLIAESMQNECHREASSEKLARGDVLLSPLVLKYLPRDLVEAYEKFQNKAAEYLALSRKAPKANALKSTTEGSSTQEYKLQIYAPMNQVMEKLRYRGIVDKSGEPVHLDVLLSQEDLAIVQWYGRLAMAVLDFFRCCDNFATVKERVDYHIRRSCLRTLAAKHKSTAYKMSKKFSVELTTHYPTRALLHSMDKMFLVDPQPVDDTLSLILTKINKKPGRAKTCGVIGCCVEHTEFYFIRMLWIKQVDISKRIDASPLYLACDRRGLPLCRDHYLNFCSGKINLHHIKLHSLGFVKEV